MFKNVSIRCRYSTTTFRYAVATLPAGFRLLRHFVPRNDSVGRDCFGAYAPCYDCAKTSSQAPAPALSLSKGGDLNHMEGIASSLRSSQ